MLELRKMGLACLQIDQTSMRQNKTPFRELFHVVRCEDNFGGVFALATRVSYPVEVKMQAIKMRLAGAPVREVNEGTKYT